MTKVLIVDDHALIRKGVISELSEASDITVVAEAGDGESALSIARDLQPDVVLLDIALPGKSGIEVLKSLRAEVADVKVLILSGFAERQYAIRCIKDGAKGYVSKGDTSVSLVDAVRRVMKGRTVISPDVADLMTSELSSDMKRYPHDDLSDREFEILCLLAKGNTISDISRILSITMSSVSTYRHRILMKMHMQNTAQLIRYALEYDLVIVDK